MKFANLIYIGIITPLNIGFNLGMQTKFIVLEVISLFISLISILVKLRTEIMLKREITIEFSQVF